MGTVRGFFSALRARDVPLIRSLAAEDPTLLSQYDPKHCCGGTVMNVAVEFGDKDLLQALLDLGADPNQPSDWPPGPFRALNSIPKRHREELGPWLIERGAQVDAHAAALLGMEQELEALLENDPDGIHRKGPDGQRPLHVARTPAIAAYLLDRGADLEAECVDHGSRPAEYAASDRPDVCRLLLERGARGDEFMYAMIGDVDRLATAIDADPEVLYARTTPDRFTPTEKEAAHIYMYTIGLGATLVHAAVAGSNGSSGSSGSHGSNGSHGAIVRYLAERGLDPNLRGGYDDQTPCHAAAWADDAPIIRVLSECGADLDLPSGEIHRNQPVGWAVVNGSVEAVQTLVELGAKIYDNHIDQAKAGIAGKFQDWSDAGPDAFRRILEVLENGQGPQETHQ